MPNESTIVTADGETGTGFVAVSAGLTAAMVTRTYGNVRRRLGPVVGYARFGSEESEAVYAADTGLHRLGSAKPSQFDADVNGDPPVPSVLQD